jgi:hypothetical protein
VKSGEWRGKIGGTVSALFGKTTLVNIAPERLRLQKVTSPTSLYKSQLQFESTGKKIHTRPYEKSRILSCKTKYIEKISESRANLFI